jgi:putative flavoprotein involved in K+ transport
MSTEHFNGFDNTDELIDTIIIGGGQAGLATGYFLVQQGRDIVILDENLRTGDSWRKRWENLKLFTPNKFNGLPGSPFPKPGDKFPTKDEIADYLETYARQFKLPVHYGIKVDSLKRNGKRYHIIANTVNFFARNVVIATGPFQVPYTPPFASQLDSSIQQIHSSAYCNPQQITANSVLIVGAGNSGAEIALELVQNGKQVWLAGRDVGRLPSNGPLSRVFGGRPLWWLMSHVLTVNTPIGRKLKAREGHQGTPLGRATRQELVNAGVELVPRVSGINSGKPQLEDSRVLPADGVIWTTGFRPDYQWIEIPIFDERGVPQHKRGVVLDYPGLYFVGLMFQTALNSSLLGGVGTDAAYIAGQISQSYQTT